MLHAAKPVLRMSVG